MYTKVYTQNGSDIIIIIKHDKMVYTYCQIQYFDAVRNVCCMLFPVVVTHVNAFLVYGLEVTN